MFVCFFVPLMTIGAETTAKLIKMRVIVAGLRGVGIETAKNLALQGAGAITLIDSAACTMQDTGSNFFIFEEDVTGGVTRSAACAPRLQELNPICEVTTAASVTEEIIKAHSALIVTQETNLDRIKELDSLCTANGVSFFYCFQGGASSTLFVNHGPDHVVVDADGERPIQKLITDISPFTTDEGPAALVRYDTPEGQVPVGLDDGHFEITEVEGVDGINGNLFPISHSWKDPVKTIRIPMDITELPPYRIGGLLTEKKMPNKYPMESFTKLLADPGMLTMTDLLKFSETLQHVTMVAILTFATEKGSLPKMYDEEDAQAVVDTAKTLLSNKVLNLEGFEVDEDYVRDAAMICSAELQPISAFLGGVLAQEVVKCTGKFTPIPGFLHFAAIESLPAVTPSKDDVIPRNHRNDELAAIYGWSFVETLGNLNYFMVGCGALGCEFMKNFALNGIFCGPQGKLYVTDADRIELSNLSRQFLFREHNVGQPKSKAAGVMAQVMNPDMKVESMEHFVGVKSEDIFNDAFWSSLSGVCNALDNMEARLYVDEQCVKYEKSLLESGTMGTSGNVDTIAPFKTRTYAEGGNAAEGGGVPMCTLRNFPHLTDHCIEWARDQFELMFVKLSKSAEKYIENPQAFQDKVRDLAGSEPGVAFFESRCLTSLLRASNNPSIESAAQMAFDIFQYLFRDRILDLQAAFPRDARMTDDNGNDIGPFWSEKKRYPTVVVFNAEDESHINFMMSATCLFASLLGVVPPKQEDDDTWCADYRTTEFVVSVVKGLSLIEYVQAPVSGAGIEGPKDMEDNIDGILAKLFTALDEAAASLTLPKYELADFEKDDDMNFHIAFITAAANLRCDNYSIKRTDFQACKVIAGKIIAAIATTTAAVCGLVILELFKLVLDHPTEKLMNRQIGLGTNIYTSFEQEPPKKFKTFVERIIPQPGDVPESAFDESGKILEEYITEETKVAYPEEHTCWDKMVIDGSITLNAFNKFLLEKHNLAMDTWNFIYGYKNIEKDGKKEKTPVTTSVYPPKPVLDYTLLPTLDLSKAQATQQLMRNQKAKPLQQYIALWSECKENGMIPEGPADAGDAITGDTTLAQILNKMAEKAKMGVDSKAIDMPAIGNLEGKDFWVIPSSDTPMCNDDNFNEVVNLVSMKITLA